MNQLNQLNTTKQQIENMLNKSAMKYKKLTMRDFNAQKYINLLKPVKCECGCGGYTHLMLEDEQIFGICHDILADEECEHAFVFVIESWCVSGACTTEDGVRYFTTAQEGNEPFSNMGEAVGFVKEMIKDVRPHCVGVLQSVGNGEFRIVDDWVYDK